MLERTKDQRRETTRKPGGPRRKLPKKKNSPEAPPRSRVLFGVRFRQCVVSVCVGVQSVRCRYDDFEPGSDVRPVPAIVSGFECFLC